MGNKKRIDHPIIDTIFLDILIKSALTIISEKSGLHKTDYHICLQFKGLTPFHFIFLKGVYK